MLRGFSTVARIFMQNARTLTHSDRSGECWKMVKEAGD